MSYEKSLSQNDVSRFLLGLGIGLVVGITFKPASDDYSRRLRESDTTAQKCITWRAGGIKGMN
jgi:hypothetical protein